MVCFKTRKRPFNLLRNNKPKNRAAKVNPHRTINFLFELGLPSIIACKETIQMNTTLISAFVNEKTFVSS